MPVSKKTKDDLYELCENDAELNQYISEKQTPSRNFLIQVSFNFTDYCDSEALMQELREKYKRNRSTNK